MRKDGAARLEIPLVGLRTRSRSYLEFMEYTGGEKVDYNKRYIFERERQNNHRNHAAFIGEKFAQQGWCIGQKVAELLFELSLYLITPELKARSEARLSGGPLQGGDGKRYAAPTL